MKTLSAASAALAYLLSTFLLLTVQATAQAQVVKQGSAPTEANASVKVVEDGLVMDSKGFEYAVTGTLYNKSDLGLVNVRIVYYIWAQYKEHPELGGLGKGGGLVTALIKYLPPHQIVAFTTDYGAPVSVKEVPQPIEAIITATFDEEAH